METVWSLDFCLTCDRQTTGEPYCSQACRLADLEPLALPSRSETASPVHSTTVTTPCSSAFLPTAPSPTAGFFLPPAFDFASYRRASPPISSRPSSSSSSGAAAATAASDSSHSSFGTLTPSSYRSHTGALAGATMAPPHGDNLSTQVRQELRDYTNSFDRVRHFRRRLTS